MPSFKHSLSSGVDTKNSASQSGTRNKTWPFSFQLSPFFVLVLALGFILTTIVVFAALPTGSPASQRLSEAASKQALSSTDQYIWSYQEVVGNEPDNLDAHATLAWLYLQKARETADPAYYSKADALLDSALKQDTSHLESLIGKGSLALARHQFQEALTLGEQARSINPHIARVYGVLADAYTELGRYDQAVEATQTMVDLRPDLSSYSRVAYARELHGDLDGAIEAMGQAVMAGGPNAENTEWTRVQLGNLYLAKGQLHEAEKTYREALLRLPNYVYAQAGLAHIYAARGESEQAIQLYQQAIDRMPLAEFVVGLGETLEAAGRTKEAQQQYALVKAMQQLQQSNGVDVDLELALFEADHGDPQLALTLAQQAYVRRPGIRGAEALAWAQYRAGQFAEAQQNMKQAMQLGTQDATLFYRAGMIAQASGDQPTAQKYLSLALQLNPNFSLLYAPQARAALGEATK